MRVLLLWMIYWVILSCLIFLAPVLSNGGCTVLFDDLSVCQRMSNESLNPVLWSQNELIYSFQCDHVNRESHDGEVLLDDVQIQRT